MFRSVRLPHPLVYKMNLREAVHIGELRTMPQGHPDYRLIVQEMWRQIAAVHPTLARCAHSSTGKRIAWAGSSPERSEYKRDSHTT